MSNFTRNERAAYDVLFDRCSKDPELRHVMTTVRGHKPEMLIKKYFRKNPMADDIKFITKQEKGIGE